MKKALSTRVSIFLSVDAQSVFKYYNSHDPAPLYNRQLSHEFQEYLQHSIASARREASIRYQLICKKESDQKFIQPILMSIRRHFEIKRTIREQEFNNFKKRNYTFLGISFLAVIILQGLLPIIFDIDHRMHSVFNNALDVFSLVILWKPIERLIFYWNPFKKEILLLNKMENAESIIIVNEKEFVIDRQYDDAA
jgi:hypothetical protein